MGIAVNAIRKTADVLGCYQYVEMVDSDYYPSVDWEHNPDVSGVAAVPRKHWKYDGTNVVSEMSQAEKDVVDSAEKVAAAEHAQWVFSSMGNTYNKWLRLAESNTRPSDRMPGIFSNDAIITELMFSTDKNLSDCDLEIYKNGVLFLTWPIRGQRVAYKTDDLDAASFAKGDTISVFIRKIGGGATSPGSVIVYIHYKYISSHAGEGGVGTL